MPIDPNTTNDDRPEHDHILYRKGQKDERRRVKIIIREKLAGNVLGRDAITQIEKEIDG